MAMGIRRLGANGRTVATGTVVAALDIGTHKICCLIAAHEPVYASAGQPSQRLRALGFGLQRSQGIEGGAVVDLTLAQAAVAAAIAQAEHTAGLRIDAVHVGVTSGNPQSSTFNGHVDVAGSVVEASDIARLDAGARAFAGRTGRALLVLNRIAYGLDATPSVRDPHGLAGQRLFANHHAVTVEAGPLRNIGLLVESCHLGLDDMLPAAYASALAVTTQDERQIGVAVVDLGAGALSIAGFADGHFVHCESLPTGGQHITRDVAYALGIPLAEAERIKTLYGSMVRSGTDEHELVPLGQEQADGFMASAATRADLTRIVAHRVEGVLAAVRSRLEACSVERIRHAGVVLTGGTSQIMGLDGVATILLGRPARVSAPRSTTGVTGRFAGSVQGPAFSCVVGLAMAASQPSPWLHGHDAGLAPPRRGYLGRVERWLRESF